MNAPIKPSIQKPTQARSWAKLASGCFLQLVGLAFMLVLIVLSLIGGVWLVNTLWNGSPLNHWPVIVVIVFFLSYALQLIPIGARLFGRRRRLFVAGAGQRPARRAGFKIRVIERRPVIGRLLYLLGHFLGLIFVTIPLLILLLGIIAIFIFADKDLSLLWDRNFSWIWDRDILSLWHRNFSWIWDRDILSLWHRYLSWFGVSKSSSWIELFIFVIILFVLVGVALIIAQIFIKIISLIFSLIQRISGGVLVSGKKLAALRAQDVLAKDSRLPVVYLRSFQDDKVTDERSLTHILNEIGPVIALGDPSERLPTLGIARMYVGEDWQQKVTDLVRRARLVVLRPGRTPSLRWEFQHVIQNAPPKKVLLLIPSHKQNYEAFSSWAQMLFPKPLPTYKGPDIIEEKLVGVVYFDYDWTPHFRNLGNPKAAFPSYTDELKWSLEPVFAQLGLSFRPPPLGRWKAISCLIILIIVSIGFVAFLLAVLVSAIKAIFPGVLPF